MTSIYRQNDHEALVVSPDQVEQGEYINGGKLERSAGFHDCPVPGWWQRWRRHIRPLDKWHCTCGQTWVWGSWDKDSTLKATILFTNSGGGARGWINYEHKAYK